MGTAENVVFRVLGAGEALPMRLLLLGDESEAMIARYIDGSRVIVAEMNGEIVGVCVVAEHSRTNCEIKNIAVDEAMQGRGIGSRLLEQAISMARDAGFERMEIATGNSGIGQLYLYQKVGFEMVGIDRDYFVVNYPEPIFENGIRCRHRVRMEMEL